MIKSKQISQEGRESIMENEIRQFVTEKTRDLINAPSCSAEAKAAAQAWLDAAGTEKEAEETRRFVKELEADIMPIDQLIRFADSEKGRKCFGADRAAGIAAHAKEIQAAGAKYCDCPACATAEAILSQKDRLLP